MIMTLSNTYYIQHTVALIDKSQFKNFYILLILNFLITFVIFKIFICFFVTFKIFICFFVFTTTEC